MRLEQLQAFLAVVETSNFHQAARQCGVSQSAISRQIQGLETGVGLPLFHRGGQIKLTLAGERLLPYAHKIAQEWRRATEELTYLRAGCQPELCVAAIHSVCAHFLPPAVQRFCQEHPQIQLRVTSLGSDRALKVLKDGLVDLAVVMHNRFLTTGPEMVVDLLYNESIQILMAANHPLTQYSAIPWTELARHPQVVFKDGYGMQRLVQEQFQRQGVEFRAALELNTLDAFRGIIRQSHLIALLPQGGLLDAQEDPTLAIRDIATSTTAPLADPPLTRQVVLVTTHDRLMIPPIRHFRQLVLELMTPQFPTPQYPATRLNPFLQLQAGSSTAEVLDKGGNDE